MIEGLQPYAEYKESGLPWLDAIPGHWEMIPNRALMKDQRQVVGERASDYMLLSLTLQGVIARDMENPKGKFPAQFNTYKVVRPNDIIFCLFDIDETPRGVGLSSRPGMITGAYDVFTPAALINSKFLYHYYRFIDDGKLMKPLYTGLRKTIQRGTFASLKTPVPPPDEQAAIVRFLDHANRKIDGFIRAKRKLISLLGEQKQAIIHRAVTRGLNPNAPLKPSGIEWLEAVPAHWKTRPNRSLFQIRKRIVGSRHREFQVLSLTKRGVIVRDMDAGGKFSSFWERSQEVRPGNMVFCFFDVDETPRGVGLSHVKGMISPDYTVMECPPETIASYLELFYIAMDDHKMLKPLYTGLRKRISKPLFLAAKTPIPPDEELRAIVEYTKTETKGINTAIARTEREIALMQEYRTRLTADVVTGKLDVRAAAAKLPDLPADSISESATEAPEETEIEEEL